MSFNKLAQWLASWAHNQEVRRSKPRSAICDSLRCSRHRAFNRFKRFTGFKMFKGLKRFERLAKLKGFSGYHMGGFVWYDIQYIFIYCARNKVSRAIGSNARALPALSQARQHNAHVHLQMFPAVQDSLSEAPVAQWLERWSYEP